MDNNDYKIGNYENGFYGGELNKCSESSSDTKDVLADGRQNIEKVFPTEEALNEIIDLLKKSQVKNPCMVIEPTMGGFNVYEMSFDTIKIARQIKKFQDKYGKMPGIDVPSFS